MLVKNKGRDIAILRTMGATRGMILRIFFATGAAIGVVGTALGFVIGLSFAANIEAIRQWLQGLLEMELFPARSEEHTSELQSLMRISYAVFCLNKKNNDKIANHKN